MDSPVPLGIIRGFGYHQSIKKLQLLPQSFFITEAKEARKNIALSGYVTDNNGSFDGLEMINDDVYQRPDLNCMEEEAGSRLISHVADVRAERRLQKLPGVI